MIINDPRAALAQRILARRRLITCAQMLYPTYQAGWVHQDIAQRLERFYEQVKLQQSPRLMLNMPPRLGKSMLASTIFPAWLMGQDPRLNIILTSYNIDLPLGFSRKIRRFIRDDEYYHALFPDTNLSPDSQSAEAWATTQDGSFFAAGIGGPLTGRGADILLIDDYIKNIEEADNQQLHDKHLDWYQSTAYTRLAPGGGVIIIACMTGDTPVLRPDGTSTPLAEIRPGDRVVTYDNGQVAVRRVLNHQSSGIDHVYAIRTTSGIVVRANERHPFLVYTPEGLRWKRVRELKPQDLLVRLPGVVDPHAQKQSPDCAIDAKEICFTTNDTLMRHTTRKGTGENTEALPVQSKGVAAPLQQKGCVPNTTLCSNGVMAKIARVLKKAVTRTLNIVTELPLLSTIGYWLNKEGYALFVDSRQAQHGIKRTINDCVSTIAIHETPKARSTSGDSYVTPATLPQGTPRHPKLLNLWLNTSGFIPDSIASITPCGRDEVFDVQIEGTENFIANGLVSHNTRWSFADLSGQLQQLAEADPEADRFEVVDYAAVAESYEYRDRATHHMVRSPEPLPVSDLGLELLRRPGEVLHPERFSEAMVRRIRANLSPRVWSALYQQKPAPDEGLFFKKEYIKRLADMPYPNTANIFTAWDFAITTKTHNDYTSYATMVYDASGMVFIPMIGRFKRDTYGIVAAIVNHAEQVQRTYPHLAHVMGFEDGQIFKAIEPVLRTEMQKRRVFFSYEVLSPTTDKMVRARPLQAIMQQGIVYFAGDIPLMGDVEEELLQFPAGRHDDFVDALSWAARMVVAKPPPVLQRTPPIASWKDKLKTLTHVGGSRNFMGV